MSSRYRAHPDVIFTALDGGEGVLLKLPEGRTFTLNPTATCIWRQLAEGHGEAAAVRELTAGFEVDEAGARTAVRRFVDEAVANELLLAE